MSKSVVDRVLSHCSGTHKPDGCWTWHGARRGAYGLVRVKLDGGKWSLRNVHRVVYAEARNTVPDGVSVIHTCGNKLCCNPRHLQLKVQPFVLTVSASVEDIA